MSYVGRLAANHGAFFARPEDGHDITSRRAQRIVQWFSDHWPLDLAWPTDIPRPEPAANSPAAILDDWGLSKLTAPQRRDLLEILEDRHEQRSTLVTSQIPIEHWHKMIGEPTHADAILDRLVHNAYRIALKGESMRKIKAKGGGSLTAQP